jgi:hypothetical protein
MICTQCLGIGNLFFLNEGRPKWIKCELCKGTGIFECECLKISPHPSNRGSGEIRIKSKIKSNLTWDQCQIIDGTDHKPPNKQKNK